MLLSSSSMEIVAGIVCVTGLSWALSMTTIPPYLTVILVFCAASSVILEVKTIDSHLLETELGWKLRRGCSKGIFCVILLPFAVILSTFHYKDKLHDDFNKMLLIMSVAAILAPLAVLSYTLLLVAKKNSKMEGGGSDTDGTATSTEQAGSVKSEECSDVSPQPTSEKEKTSKKERKSKSNKDRSNENNAKEKDTKTTKLPKDLQEINAKVVKDDKNTRENVSPLVEGTEHSESKGVRPDEKGRSSAIQLEKNASNIMNVIHLVCVVGIGLFMLMAALKTVGVKGSLLLIMHTLLLCILQTTLPVLMPRSFSMGEATVCAQALTYFQLLLSAQLWFRFEWLQIKSEILGKVSEVTAFTEVALLSCLLVVVALLFCPSWRTSQAFYVLVPGVMVVFSLPSLYVLLQKDFVTWIVQYVGRDASKRYLFVYWAIATVLAVLSVYFNAYSLKQQQLAAKPTFHLPAKIRNRIRASQIVEPSTSDSASTSEMSSSPPLAPTDPIHPQRQRANSTEEKAENDRRAAETTSSTVRKQFHLLAVAVFVPGLVVDTEITCCAWSCALVVFIMLECLRLVRVWPWYSVLEQYLRVFLDARDEGPVIMTPIYLLAGCTLPLWIYQKYGSHIVLYSGVLSLGVGDTMASIIGTKYGRHKWAGSQKSIEGTMANVLSQVIFLAVLIYSGYSPGIVWSRVLPAVCLTALVEAFTSQIDNLLLPLFMFCMTVT